MEWRTEERGSGKGLNSQGKGRGGVKCVQARDWLRQNRKLRNVQIRSGSGYRWIVVWWLNV